MACLNLQIVSDLHIEYKNDEIPNPLDYITPTAEILILAGDIGSLYKIKQLKGFLDILCKHFKIVIYVPGNHEYYLMTDYNHLSMEELTNRLLNLEKDIDNLYILNRTSIIIGDICITGCTLWSKVNVKIPRFIVKINDMNNDIYDKKFSTDLKYINQMIKYCKARKLKLVVVTHYCPTYKVLDNIKTKKDKFISLYVSNLEYLLNSNYIHTWICGHIHHNFDFKSENGTRIVGNQLGKPRDKITDFLKDFVVQI